MDARSIETHGPIIFCKSGPGVRKRYRNLAWVKCQVLASELGISGSHDDATLAHVEASVRYGMTIAKFPTTLEAAKGCQALNMKVLMVAPNVVRGGSHSGNVAAAGLTDRGEIAIGLRADLVQAKRRAGRPVVQQVWRQAKRVF